MDFEEGPPKCGLLKDYTGSLLRDFGTLKPMFGLMKGLNQRMSEGKYYLLWWIEFPIKTNWQVYILNSFWGFSFCQFLLESFLMLSFGVGEIYVVLG